LGGGFFCGPRPPAPAPRCSGRRLSTARLAPAHVARPGRLEGRPLSQGEPSLPGPGDGGCQVRARLPLPGGRPFLRLSGWPRPACGEPELPFLVAVLNLDPIRTAPASPRSIPPGR
jgi:hypothetical protein